MQNSNREYKDRLFKFLFGNSDHKDWTLSLYNAVNGSNHQNADDIIFTTIEDAIYMSMKNDVSFLITDTMNFYEHQSTFNPNMPMRFLIYAGMVYSKYIENTSSYHRFSKKQQKAPVPKCICFYNGEDDKEDKVILSLSDSFAPDTISDIEVKVTMININYGRNKELMKVCRPLSEYALFIDNIRKNLKSTNDHEAAIDKAIDDLPKDSIIKSFLINNKAEVKLMCITEYNEARTLAEERAEGKTEGKFEVMKTLIDNKMISVNEAAKMLNMTVNEFTNKLNEICD